MKKILFLTLTISALASQAYYKYDYTSGNTYYNLGKTHYGMNNKGQTWSTTYDNNGGASGYDKNNNYWTLDKNDNYFNYGTGKSCYGTGIYRTCN